MASLTLRLVKGSELTWAEVDNNFTALNAELSTTAITGGSINGATIGGTAPSTGAFTTLSASSTVSGTGFSTYLASPPAIGGTAPAAGTFTTLTATGQTSLGGAAGSEAWRFLPVASAVNYFYTYGATTGNSPTVESRGSDANVNQFYVAKGSGRFTFFTNGGGSVAEQLRVSHTASAVNYWSATGSATTNAPIFSVQGSDTNISQVFQPKGTGAIDLAAGSSGVNISNGGTVTAITRTNSGSGYTSFPSITISAPTTAGGVQATASVFTAGSTAATIQSGGTGYALNDVISTNAGASQSSAATFTVTGVSGGVITALASTGNGGAFTAIPTNPVSTTGNTGTGATLNLSNFYIVGLLLLTAGSGYVEQPTVTFSGGGGSGAAAYATVGSIPTVKSIGAGLSFYTPQGEQVRIIDGASGATNSYVALRGSPTSNPLIYAAGQTNANLDISSAGGSSVRIYTNTFVQQQLSVAHTASAVNYVQVTGAATNGATVISAQGSDSNININLQAKGSGQIRTLGWMSVGIGAPNYWQMASASAGAAPVISVAGSDTNIDLSLTPKGTGLVRFGIYTADSLIVPTGYINIKAADGTTYKLLVST